MSRPIAALILAGRRAGEPDPVATAAGVACKAFAEIGGIPMAERVIAALRAMPEIDAVFIVLPDAVAAEGAPGLAELLRQGTVRRLSAAASPALSVVAALDHLPPSAPLLVTTADHALLTPAMLRVFLDGANGVAAAAAAVVPLDVVLEKYPHARRTRLAFRDGAYKGANLFYFSSAAAAGQAASFWRRLENLRKEPWRMALMLGPVFLLRYIFHRLTLAGAVAHLGRLTGLDFRTVPLPIAEAAFDVDSVADLETIRRIAAGL